MFTAQKKSYWIVAFLCILIAATIFWALSTSNTPPSSEPSKASPFLEAEARYERALDLWDYLGTQEQRWEQALAEREEETKSRGDSPSLEIYFRQVAELMREEFRLAAPQQEGLDLSINNRCFSYVKYVMNKLPGEEDFSITALALATVARNKGAMKQALEYLSLSLFKKKQRDPFSLNQARIHHAKALVAWKGTLHTSAEANFAVAIRALEGRIADFGSLDRQGELRARFPNIYKDAVAFHLERNARDEAYAVLELYRGRSLLQMFAEKGSLLELPPHLEAEWHKLCENYDRVQHDIIHFDSEHQEESELDALTEQRLQLYEQRDRWYEAVRRDQSVPAALHYPRALDRKESQNALAPGTLMLSYNVGKRSTDIFVLSKESGLSVFETDIREHDLRSDIERYVRLTHEARPGHPEAQKELRELARLLYLELIEPASEFLPKSERFLIIPDGPLHLLPWGSLILRPGGSITRGSENPGASENAEIAETAAFAPRNARDLYLIEWKPIHTALSATVYFELEGRTEPADQKESNTSHEGLDLVAFGDPDYSTHELALSSSIPSQRGLRPGLYKDWPPLPKTRKEVEGIVALHPSERAQIFLRHEATEEAVKHISPHANVLHFATHGHLDHEIPMDSAILLTQPPEPEPENGWLQAWEIARMRLKSKLVVLSACGSALGEEQAGEGLISLTRAFQIAGARSVIASLWEVEDSSTSDLMLELHRGLKEGKAIDEALRAAQLKLIARPGPYAAPFYWAAFQVYGSRKSPFPSWDPNPSKPTSDPVRSRPMRLPPAGDTLFVSRFAGSEEVVFHNQSEFYSSPPGYPLQASSNGQIPGGWRAGRDLNAEHQGSDPWLRTQNGKIQFQGGQGQSSDNLIITHPLTGIPESWFLEIHFVAAKGDLNNRPFQLRIAENANHTPNRRRFRFRAGLSSLQLNEKSRPFLGLKGGKPYIARIWNLRDRAVAEVYPDLGGLPGKLLGAVESDPSDALDAITLIAGNYVAGVFTVDHVELKTLLDP